MDWNRRFYVDLLNVKSSLINTKTLLIYLSFSVTTNKKSYNTRLTNTNHYDDNLFARVDVPDFKEEKWFYNPGIRRRWNL